MLRRLTWSVLIDLGYSGPLLIEECAIQPSEPEPGEKFRVLATNSTDPDDALAIKIGNLHVDASKKQKLDVQSSLDQIRTLEKQQEYAELEELKKKRQIAQKLVDDAKEQLKNVEKSVEVNANELKRKYGSP
ncbi:unnamed protein product [Rotaria magnacalcarata]|uniref:Uncharacterized protein n=1 Tax=Rotaria magnacalcarata TaxID=392030 RepID=A0A816YLR2_9BILA|nr:unnamed protein product [Rotaria magnacalcarata]CAF3990973.1 unnamed protein product [Rotaria magnacalcarata]